MATPISRRRASMLLVAAAAVLALGCGQSREEERREAFEQDLRTALAAQQVPEDLIDCTVEVTRNTLTDQVLQTVPPEASTTQLAGLIAQQQPALSAACQSSPLAR
jgi:hypothetical protein